MALRVLRAVRRGPIEMSTATTGRRHSAASVTAIAPLPVPTSSASIRSAPFAEGVQRALDGPSVSAGNQGVPGEEKLLRRNPAAEDILERLARRPAPDEGARRSRRPRVGVPERNRSPVDSGNPGNEDLRLGKGGIRDAGHLPAAMREELREEHGYFRRASTWAWAVRASMNGSKPPARTEESWWMVRPMRWSVTRFWGKL